MHGAGIRVVENIKPVLFKGFKRKKNHLGESLL
jgi:hypothetical protein